MFNNLENIDVTKIEVEKKINVVFMGTPDFSVPILQVLLDNYNVRAVVTQPDKPVGRSGKIKYSPIKELALKHNLLILQPNKLRLEYQEVLALEPDIIVTCAYGQLVPKEILEYPKYGCINVHASLLPKLRGGAPIHRAIINGFTKTGITIMYMNEGLDTGDMIAQKEIEITDTDTASTLHDKLSILGSELLRDTLPLILSGNITRTPQDETLATYGFNIKPEDEKINFDKTKREIYNQIRGLNDWPGAYCMLDGKRMKVYSSYETYDTYPEKINGEITRIYKDGFGVKVANGEIVITELQIEGKSRVKASDYLNGVDKNLFVNKVLG